MKNPWDVEDNNENSSNLNKETQKKLQEEFLKKIFEMILYSFRFCVQSLEALDFQKNNQINKKLLFASLLNKNCLNDIKECYIPGNEMKEGGANGTSEDNTGL